MQKSDPILFYSDFNCPFCYSLNERIIAIGAHHRIDWRCIEHMPFADSAQRSPDVQSQLMAEVAVIRKRAPEIFLVTPSFRPSSRPANQLVYTLRDEPDEKLQHLHTLIYRAYWQKNLDIQDLKVLKLLVAEVELEWPEEFDSGAELHPSECQSEWEGENFKQRLPALYSVKDKRPLMGFPTYELLCNFVAGEELPVIPDSLAACEMRPRQEILIITDVDSERINCMELEAVYSVKIRTSIEHAQQYLQDADCWPEMVLIDLAVTGDEGLDYCRKLRLSSHARNIAIALLLDETTSERELQAFDSGASDVIYNLSDAKICQARGEMQMRIKRSTAYLDAMNRLDYLTELPNRREFDRKLEEEWARLARNGGELSVLMIDIDYFKHYNDHYGHAAGDDCLRQVAAAMFACLHRSTDMLARYGGEEFAAILPNTDLSGAVTLAHGLKNAVEALQLPHEKSKAAAHVTISIGIACTRPNPKVAPTELIKVADQSLYEAKAEGRNRYRSAEKTLFPTSVSLF